MAGKPVRTVIPDVILPRPIRGKHTGKAPLIRKMKLRYPELSDKQIAERVGCDPKNATRVLATFLGVHTDEELKEYQDNKADIYDALQLRELGSITDEDISKNRALPRIIGAGILEDKARTIRGQATSINVNVLLDAVEAIRALRKE